MSTPDYDLIQLPPVPREWAEFYVSDEDGSVPCYAEVKASIKMALRPKPPTDAVLKLLRRDPPSCPLFQECHDAAAWIEWAMVEMGITNVR